MLLTIAISLILIGLKENDNCRLYFYYLLNDASSLYIIHEGSAGAQTCLVVPAGHNLGSVSTDLQTFPTGQL
jgi:hypothetical protein